LSQSPAGFRLLQNYPNPFNPVTTIRFAIPAGARDVVSLQVFDVLGREVATLVNRTMEPGEHRTEFDATELPSGVYLYRVKAGGFMETRKMIVVR
jgi:hypothetical protein